MTSKRTAMGSLKTAHDYSESYGVTEAVCHESVVGNNYENANNTQLTIQSSLV